MRCCCKVGGLGRGCGMTKYTVIVVLCGLLSCCAKREEVASDPLPRWAYAEVSTEVTVPAPAETSERRVADSDQVYLYSQVHDPFFAPDWHPEEHAEMPPIVEFGREPKIFACAFCHRATGTGGPENASIDGLTAAYMKRQILNFKNGDRPSSVPSRAPVVHMLAGSELLTDEEIEAAVNYFSALAPKSIVTVIEAAEVPLTFERGWHLAVLDADTFEPIGERIIEVPVDLQQFMNRDSRAEFVAYVPPGSLERGKDLSAGRGVRFAACVTCHGEGLRGIGDFPRLAGRSPSYLMRQLYDFKHGARTGIDAATMIPIAKELSQAEMIDLSAYIASLRP